MDFSKYVALFMWEQLTAHLFTRVVSVNNKKEIPDLYPCLELQTKQVMRGTLNMPSQAKVSSHTVCANKKQRTNNRGKYQQK